MKWNRIWAILLQNYYIFRHSIDRQTEVFYWSAVDLMLWGITSLYFLEVSNTEIDIVLSIVSGVVFWYFLWSAQNEFNMGILQQLWYRNMINIFASPIKFSEMTVALILSGIIKASITFTSASIVAFLLFRVTVFNVGIWLIPFAAILLLTGWIYAFIMSGIVIRFGTTVQSLTWSLVFVLSPFSAVYFPVSILPGWAQVISKFFPTSYVFESMRAIISTGTFEKANLVYAFLLIIIYFGLAYLWLRVSFAKALEKGLVSLK